MPDAHAAAASFPSEPRWIGANIYWLGLDDAGGAVRAPSAFRTRDVLESASAFGLNLIRSHMLISSSPVTGAIRPAPYTYAQQAFAPVDRALALCGELGLRLVLPLTDQWEYYHGGRRDFTAPHGLTPEEFFTAPAAIADFEDYVCTVLTRVNPLTGIRYGEDPAVLAWETGNELRGAPPEWTSRIARLLHELSPEALVAAGSRSGVEDAALSVPEVDVIDVHAYPPTPDRVLADARRVRSAGKRFLLGEFDSRACRTGLMDALAEDPDVWGMAFWSLFGRDDHGGLSSNDDGFALHIPGRDTDARERLAGLRRCCDAAGLTPRSLPPAAPTVLHVERGAGARVRFRGARGIDSYLLQHRELGTWVNTTGIVMPPQTVEAIDPEPVPGREYRVIDAAQADEAALAPAA